MDLTMYFLSILLLFGVSSGLAQDSTENYKSCGNQKLCVPIFLCESGEINTDGANIIDIYSSSTASVTNATSNSKRKRRQTSPAEETECAVLEKCCNTQDETKTPVVTEIPKITQEPITSSQNVSCGLRNPDGIGFRITDAPETETNFGESPWMAGVLREETDSEGVTIKIYKCGGALIAPTVVITAAVCVQNISPNKLIVRAGEWDVQTKNEIFPHQDRRVHEIISHEKFNKHSLINNIALLIVDSPYEYAENVRPLCLPPPNTNFDLARCYATGWGKDKLGKEGKYQVILKKVPLPIVPRDKCQQNLRTTRLGKFFNLHESFTCAGGELGKGVCMGDGGSPLVCPIAGKTNQFYHAGIVAWGIGCGEENVPGVFANVAQLRPWLNEKLAKLGIDFGHFTA